MSDQQDIHRYNDMIALPHPTSGRHPRMSLYQRAAQFSPFAALTGHDAAIKETARLTDAKIELSETEKARLDEKLRIVMQELRRMPTISITHFVPDAKKDGGAYTVHTGRVRRIDACERLLILQDRTTIPIEQIYEIEGDVFAAYGWMK